MESYETFYNRARMMIIAFLILQIFLVLPISYYAAIRASYNIYGIFLGLNLLLLSAILFIYSHVLGVPQKHLKEQ
ncbi:MAG TPA: hypothetical protein ENH28_07610 [Euryarchaeota archaeon]|nr:hypothetical protein BMS3Bbin15_01274 [archaeon BMS3Bbin15]HDL16000.1 hypothetical protein [Euryarchaeota archaeon]